MGVDRNKAALTWQARALAAEAKVTKVEAVLTGWWPADVPGMGTADCAEELFAVLADVPAEVTPPAERRDDWCTCGHLREHHDGVNGCYRGDPGAGWDCTCLDFTPKRAEGGA